MLVALRISGRVDISGKEKEVMNNLKLRKKNVCVLNNDKKLLEKMKMLIAYGEIDDETLKMLISKRGRKPGDKPIAESAEIIVKKLKEGKKLDELGIKPFFRLQPPRGGFKKASRFLYPRGVLGENKKISELIRRML